MTNTLHRYGTAESFKDDYVIFALPAKGGAQTGDPKPALRRFLEIALDYNPVNIGDAIHGGGTRPTEHSHAMEHFARRPTKPDFQRVMDGLGEPTTYSAVFATREDAEAFVQRIVEEDLGLSINISSSIENAQNCCKAAGITRHSVGYSLGFEGIQDNAPNRHVLALSTMCGHGMISQSLAKKMIDMVKENRASPDKVTAALSRFCSCGIFNPVRARRIIEEARKKTF
ncbi:hypothetical protein NDN01_16230 [Sphingomonas sp. QA11]|uniref:hypothetical protein n=1 Tax=Sphingomonas sp. QA11 TaxID=2950605 RepID=UPI0023496801|nr:MULTISPECIES: hypothetical protein [unclassified Sphingomonas]WCM25585.1 hypothetical protein NDN01_16230 [Sphingomonas sp. QA11]WEJ99648.1 MAG: hypothetical protein P0Y59_22520 [Sphingomonas sp.]